MHRWTARALAQLHPEIVTAAHDKAARYWQWCVEQLPDIGQLVEARYHHHAAGDVDQAVDLTFDVVKVLVSHLGPVRPSG